MKLRKYQHGAGLWSLVFGLGLLGFAVFTALKLVPVYLDDFAIESSVKGLEADSMAEYRGALSVKQALYKRFDINNVKRLHNDEIRIMRDGDTYNVEVSYEVKVQYLGNISLLISFDHFATVKASV